MNFIVSERIKTDKEKSLVLSELKESLEKISSKLEVQGDILVVEGIATTFGSVNRKDRTEIILKEKDNGFLISAEVVYKPSMLFWILLAVFLFIGIIGIVLPIGFYLWHKSLVKTELEKCFLNIKNEFDNYRCIIFNLQKN